MSNALSDSVDWTGLLNRTRQSLKTDESSSSKALDVARAHFPQLRDLLQSYNNVLLDPGNVSKENKKKIVVDTRSALRVALSCSSIENAEIRDQVLKEAVVELAWQKPLVHLLMNKKGDSKCRVLASQLLSNLVTSHGEAAEVVTTYVALSPSRDAVADRIRQSLVEKTEEYEAELNVEPNWVDMMLVSAHANNRASLAGIVAALHNSIVSLQKCSSDREVPWAFALASDRILVSTLLRQMVPVQSVKHMIDNTNNQQFEKEGGTEQISDSLGDSATEWISLLLLKICKLGGLPNLISSISGDTIATMSEISIYPEHVVLLQCIHSEMDTSESKAEILLGGEAGTQGVVFTHLFLAEFYSSLRRNGTAEPLTSSQTQSNAFPDWTMNSYALVTILEILATSLGQDGHDISTTRIKLGEHACALISEVGKHLGALVDSISFRNEGRKSRDFVMLDEEQHLVTALVQVIGNVCFQCRQNQELLRLTKVPLLNREQIISPSSGLRRDEERNALHVLLSCTSLGHSCFTLREWAVIAIRNVLDNNANNQAEVAKLEANKPVQSAELASLGIRVEMDPKGNVSVVPSDSET